MSVCLVRDRNEWLCGPLTSPGQAAKGNAGKVGYSNLCNPGFCRVEHLEWGLGCPGSWAQQAPEAFLGIAGWEGFTAEVPPRSCSFRTPPGTLLPTEVGESSSLPLEIVSPAT